jgi:predicted adenylyl cyclase CyaB
MIEIELRAKLSSRSPEQVTDSILGQDGIFVSESQETDIYFKHATDVERKLILRIRKKESGAQLTFKAKAVNKDTAWADVDLDLTEPDNLENILRGSNYVEVVKISKKRKSYTLENFEINIDVVENLGAFVEVEGRGVESEREQIERKIKSTLNNIGVAESDIIYEGYVPLMLKALNS